MCSYLVKKETLLGFFFIFLVRILNIWTTKKHTQVSLEEILLGSVLDGVRADWPMYSLGQSGLSGHRHKAMRELIWQYRYYFETNPDIFLVSCRRLRFSCVTFARIQIRRCYNSVAFEFYNLLLCLLISSGVRCVFMFPRTNLGVKHLKCSCGCSWALWFSGDWWVA